MSYTLARFTVLGTPAPQGSKSIVQRGDKVILLEGKTATGRARHKAWRGAVAARAEIEHLERRARLDGPLVASIVFRIAMPARRPPALRDAGIGPHIVQPDIDKLIRSTFDGLKDGGLIVDDARICQLHVHAVETTGWTGAAVLLERPTAIIYARFAYDDDDHGWLERAATQP